MSALKGSTRPGSPELQAGGVELGPRPVDHLLDLARLLRDAVLQTAVPPGDRHPAGHWRKDAHRVQAATGLFKVPLPDADQARIGQIDGSGDAGANAKKTSLQDERSHHVDP
jgi:hypothetical protein